MPTLGGAARPTVVGRAVTVRASIVLHSQQRSDTHECKDPVQMHATAMHRADTSFRWVPSYSLGANQATEGRAEWQPQAHAKAGPRNPCRHGPATNNRRSVWRKPHHGWPNPATASLGPSPEEVRANNVPSLEPRHSSLRSMYCGLFPVWRDRVRCFYGTGGRSRRQHTREFKLEAVRPIGDRGVSYAQVFASRRLGGAKSSCCYLQSAPRPRRGRRLIAMEQRVPLPSFPEP